MGEKGLRAWKKRRRKVGVFVTGFSSSYLSLSLSPISTSSVIFHPPAPPYFHRSLSLSHCFSIVLLSSLLPPPLITHPPTLTFPPIVLSTISSLPPFPKTPQYSRQERPMRPTEHCAKADKKMKRESKQGPPETQL